MSRVSDNVQLSSVVADPAWRSLNRREAGWQGLVGSPAGSSNGIEGGHLLAWEQSGTVPDVITQETSYPEPPALSTRVQEPTGSLWGRYLRHTQAVRNWLTQVDGLPEPDRRAAIADFAKRNATPLNQHILERAAADPATSGMLETVRSTRGAVTKNIAERIHRGTFAEDPSALPRVMIQERNPEAFDELGREIRWAMGPAAKDRDVARAVGGQLENLGLRSADDMPTYLEVSRHRTSPYDPLQTLVNGGIGGCGELAHATEAVLRGAGLSDVRSYYATMIPQAPLEGVRNHGVAAFNDQESGQFYVVDPWLHGSSREGNLRGFSDSPANGGLTLADWWALQASDMKPFLNRE